MSLSILLVPLAIGATSALATVLDKEVEQGNLYKIETGMKKESLLRQALRNYGCTIEESSESGLKTTIGAAKLYFKEERNGTLSAVLSNDVALNDAKEFLTDVQQEYVRLVQEETYQKLLQRAEKEGLILETDQVLENQNRVLTFQVR